MHGKISQNYKKYLAWLPALFVTAAIFYFSAQPADVSTEMSDGVTTLLLQIAEAVGLLELSPSLVGSLCEQLSTPVRKCAHITEYMILHAAILFGLYHWSENMSVNRVQWLKYAWIMTVVYAMTDEVHQLFVQGRAGRITDVLIDSIGVTMITVILWKKRQK